MPTPNVQLRRERQLRGWSQAHLAQQIDVPDYYISRWERGDVTPSPYYQQKLCELFGKTAEELGMLLGKDKISVHEEPVATDDSHPVSTTPSTTSNNTVETHNEQVELPEQVPVIASLPSESSSDEQSDLPSVPPSLDIPDMPAKPPLTTSSFPLSRPLQPLLQDWKSLALITLVLVVLLSGGWTLFLYRSQPRLSTSSVVGHLSFLSSGQVSETSNQGIADRVYLEIHPLPEPVAGKGYYAWLLPDEVKPESIPIRLGQVTLRGGNGYLLYDDPQHVNLLSRTSHVLVTEEASDASPLSESLNKSDWRYSAQIPNDVPHNDNYSYLDHLRHLLTDDPVLKTHHLEGGLTIWLYRKTHTLYNLTVDAKKAWQTGGANDVSSIRSTVLSILENLDGVSCVKQDLPTRTLPPKPSDERIVTIGLLGLCAQQNSSDYMSHVNRHLGGLESSQEATSSLKMHIAQIKTAMSVVNVWMQRVYQYAKLLVDMSDDQLRQPQALTLLNDMETNANNALLGKTNTATGNVQEGVEWISKNIQDLAVVDIKPYSE